LKNFFVVGLLEHLFDSLSVNMMMFVNDWIEKLLIMMFLNTKSLFHELRIDTIFLGHVLKLFGGFLINGFVINSFELG